MRFLCLHGMGTSSQIMQMQTAAIRHELGDGHIFDFVEGHMPAATAPELADLFSAGGGGGDEDGEADGYFAYFDPTDAPSCATALDLLDRYLEVEGPYDGVLGFSQGAALAATYAARWKARHPERAPPFKCAVFFAGGPVADWDAIERGKMALADVSHAPQTKEEEKTNRVDYTSDSECASDSGISMGDGDSSDHSSSDGDSDGENNGDCAHRTQRRQIPSIETVAEPEAAATEVARVAAAGYIDMPTCHVWGRNDTLWPGTSPNLVRACSERKRCELIWDGGHEVPGSSHQDVVVQSVHLIRRTIDMALTEQ